jgi:cytochrome c-type biogenesis protein CcmH
MIRHILTALFALAILSVPALAISPDEMLADPAKEALARSISAELRCLNCQSETIDESHAPIAHDLRLLVRERIQAGETRDQILDFLVGRYGEFVLMRPRFNTRTFLLWAAPALLAAAGAYLVYRVLHGTPGNSDKPTPLSDIEKAKLASILDDKLR